MRNLLVSVLLSVSLMTACKEEKKTNIVFCAALDSLGNCLGKADKFPRETRVFVRFDSKEPFKGSKLTGVIFALEQEQKIFLGSREFNLKPGEKRVSYFIPFDRFKSSGVYQIEFMDENGQVLDSSNVTINYK
ncbi:MAG: hypothetical protein NW226_20500 [Microscillaceae bacterium]|nr:hypothetical protein [Microscillaceae bacterium]